MENHETKNPDESGFSKMTVEATMEICRSAAEILLWRKSMIRVLQFVIALLRGLLRARAALVTDLRV